MSWYQRKKSYLDPKQNTKIDLPKDYWFKTPKGTLVDRGFLEKNFFVAPDAYHFRIAPERYFDYIFDDQKRELLFSALTASDKLLFVDTKAYTDRLAEAIQKTGKKEAIDVAFGHLEGKKLVVAAMDFRFIGGSMGAIMGEKIALAVDFCLEQKAALMIISQTGGARMMEAAFSLMQMAKTSAKLRLLGENKLPYISYMTHPTTGGVSASFAMLGDFNIAEPGALIGFAGPRVIKETIGRDLPEGFQTAEFLLEHGFLDFIIDRREIRKKLSLVLDFFEK